MTRTASEALEAAKSFLKSKGLERFGYDPMVDSETIRKVEGGYIVSWNSAKFLQTRSIEDAVAGNAPVFIDEVDGVCRRATTAECRDYYSMLKQGAQ